MNRIQSVWHRWCEVKAGNGKATAPQAPAGESAEQRLARLASWCLDGRLAAAELELYEWRRDEACPADARLLLAACLGTRGEYEAARFVLRDPHSHVEDPESMQLQIAMLLAEDLVETARRAVKILHHTHGHMPQTTAFLKAVNAPDAVKLPAITDSQAEHLAADLAARPQVFASLVAAQKLDPHTDEIALLRHAAPRLLRDAHGDERATAEICLHIAELALLAGDHDDARRHAHRGLRANPYSAALALVLSRIDDDSAVGPRATEVLERAVQANPTYPDLRAALIRRHLREGDAGRARRKLGEWLDQQPGHPLALAVEKELAA